MRGIVGEAAEIAEHAGIGFRAAEAEAGGDGQRHLVAAMREHATARPAVPRQHIERSRILRDAVGLRRVDLDDVVALGLEAAEAHQVFHVLRREQILAGRQRRRVDAGDLGEQREVERIARLLEPAQAERRQPARISKRVGAIEFRVGVDRKLRALGRIDFTASTRARSSASAMPPTFIFTMV